MIASGSFLLFVFTPKALLCVDLRSKPAMASMATCFTLPPNPFKASLLRNRSKVPEYRASAPVVRANIADEIRPGSAIESDKLPSDVRKRAMEAVGACGRRVTVGDVAGRAGLKLFEAQKALQALASDTHGFLEVLSFTIFYTQMLVIYDFVKKLFE